MASNQKSARIRTALFPVAGLGTRFLPATKASPKEMLPVLDKPLIQYAVEEAVATGIEQIIFVTSHAKRAIEDHFDFNGELENHLEKNNKWEALEKVRAIAPPHISFVYVRQPEPLGLGDAVLRARHIIGDQAFAILLADEILSSEPSCLAQLMQCYEQTGDSVLAVEAVDKRDVSHYGIVSPSPTDSSCIDRIIEKPAIDHAPSNLAVIGRYVLSPTIFSLLEKTERGHGNEIQLTDAIAALLKHETVRLSHFKGKRFDCGNPLGCLKASLHFAAKEVPVKQELIDFLSEQS